MSPLVIAWVVAGAAAFAALALLLRSRSAAERAAAAEAQSGSARDEARLLRKQLEKRDRQREGRGEETAELRRRLEKAKKRTAQLLEERRQEPVRIAGLEQDLAQKKTELQSALEELASVKSKLVRAAEAPRPDPVVVAPPAPAASPEAEAERRRAAEQLAELHGSVAELQAQLAKARDAAEQSRSRIKTQDKLYLAMRGELEAKKDRLKRQQEELERLMAMRVALLGEAPEPDPSQPEV